MAAVTDVPGTASRALAERARVHIPGAVNSNVRLDGPPIYFDRGEGAWLWDVDGKDYVDYLLGQGPAFLGHAPPAVVEAVADASRKGMIYGGQHPLEVEAAERICAALGWAEMVRFGGAGTEMVQTALRLSRAATGRKKVIRFEGAYHGWLDNILIAPGGGAKPASAGQLEGDLSQLIVLPWNDLAALEAALEQHGDEVAAVLMEPVLFNTGAIEPRDGYLAGARAACDRAGAVLIFDEVIAGFRVGLGGAAGRYGVTPDLATYGKAVAGSWPVAALAGRASLMERIGTGEVTHAGTLNANVMGMAAIVATLDILTQDPPYERIQTVGTAVMEGLRELGVRHSVPLHVQGLPMAFHVAFGTEDAADARDVARYDDARYRQLAAALVEQGVWVARRGIWYVSAAHGEREVTAALERTDAALASL